MIYSFTNPIKAKISFFYFVGRSQSLICKYTFLWLNGRLPSNSFMISDLKSNSKNQQNWSALGIRVDAFVR
jgi:hypothetical protein